MFLARSLTAASRGTLAGHSIRALPPMLGIRYQHAIYKNEKIPYETVRPVDPQTNALGPPTRLADLLKTFDRNTGHYILVSETPFPIVKFLTKDEERAKKKADKAKPRPPETKTFQMNWSIEPGDLARKLEKAKEELRKGNSVNLVFPHRVKGKTPPSQEMKHTKLKEILETMKGEFDDMQPDLKKQNTSMLLRPPKKS